MNHQTHDPSTTTHARNTYVSVIPEVGVERITRNQQTTRPRTRLGRKLTPEEIEEAIERGEGND